MSLKCCRNLCDSVLVPGWSNWGQRWRGIMAAIVASPVGTMLASGGSHQTTGLFHVVKIVGVFSREKG